MSKGLSVAAPQWKTASAAATVSKTATAPSRSRHHHQLPPTLAKRLLFGRNGWFRMLSGFGSVVDGERRRQSARGLSPLRCSCCALLRSSGCCAPLRSSAPRGSKAPAARRHTPATENVATVTRISVALASRVPAVCSAPSQSPSCSAPENPLSLPLPH